MYPTPIPPLSTLVKSGEVEDPINVHIHRPAAHLFVRLIWHTRVTPNMVTLMAVIVGITAGAMIFWGTPAAMVAGGLLIWAAAILDGADGILARAKKMQSEFGRAIDGWADMIVGFATVIPVGFHIYSQHPEPIYVCLMIAAALMTSVHLSMYDYFKETYLRATRGHGEGGDYEDAVKHVESARKQGWLSFVAVKHVLLPYLKQQGRLIRLLDPASKEVRQNIIKSPRYAEAYRKHNRGPMRLFMMTSLAPHSYLMAWCAMADQLVLYLWIRLIAMNLIFLVAILWQRQATRKMLVSLECASATSLPHTAPPPDTPVSRPGSSI